MSKPGYRWFCQSIREGLDEELLIFSLLRHSYSVQVKVSPWTTIPIVFFKIWHSELGKILEIWV